MWKKPESFVSSLINGGAYLFTSDLFSLLGEVFQANCDIPVKYVRHEKHFLLIAKPAQCLHHPAIIMNAILMYIHSIHWPASLLNEQSSIAP